MLSVFIFLFGLAIGSFLNVVILRLSRREVGIPTSLSKNIYEASGEKDENIITTRSHCPKCGIQLRWFELIPIFSFLVQKGQCRTCKEKISWQYPLVELATGLLFFLTYSYFSNQNWLVIGYLLFVISSLIVVFVYDFKYYLIPDIVVYPAILVSLVFVVFRNYQSLQEIVLSMIGAALFLSLVIVSRETWMGMGDVKLAVLMGLILGWPNILVALFISFISGAMSGLLLISLGKKSFKSQLPFGPFLVLGTFMAIFWGNQLVNWYWNLNLFTPFF